MHQCHCNMNIFFFKKLNILDTVFNCRLSLNSTWSNSVLCSLRYFGGQLKTFRSKLVEYLLVNFNWMGNYIFWRLSLEASIHYYNKWRGDDNGMWFPMTMALFAHFISNPFLIQTMILDFSTILDIIIWIVTVYTECWLESGLIWGKILCRVRREECSSGESSFSSSLSVAVWWCAALLHKLHYPSTGWQLS